MKEIRIESEGEWRRRGTNLLLSEAVTVGSKYVRKLLALNVASSLWVESLESI